MSIKGKLLNILQRVHEWGRGEIALLDLDKYLWLRYEVRKMLAKSGRLIVDRCSHYNGIRG